MNYDEVLRQFTVKKRTQNKAQCLCPAHNDSQASLTISEGDNGKILFHCHANCSTERILEAVGLSFKDIMPPQEQKAARTWQERVEYSQKAKIEGIYHYTDLQGQYVFTRLRLQGKKFIYGILQNENYFKMGLGGKKRASIAAVYCNGVGALKKAISEGKPIFYCEGEKDVNTVKSQGYTAITCGASGDWHEGVKELLKGARLFILADNDEPGKKLAEEVKRSTKDTAESVKIIIPCPDQEHADITDYFANHSTEDFEKLLTEEEPELPEQENLDKYHIMSSTGRPTGVFDDAIEVDIKEHYELFVMGGTVYLYENGCFVPDESGTKLKTMIKNRIYPQFRKSSTIKRVYDLFLMDADLELQFAELNTQPAHWINFLNGFYDPKEGKMHAHSPEYHCINQLQHHYNPSVQHEGAFLDSWLEYAIPDTQDREMILQYIGLIATKDTSFQKFMLLCGEGGTGKSTLLRLCEAFVGERNTSNISLVELSQRFASYGLMGKLLNSCADLEIEALQDVSVIKKCLGEDSLRGEQKGRDAISFKNYAKLIFSTNELPFVKNEKSNGFFRRLLILEMNQTPDKQDAELFVKLAGDMQHFIELTMEALSRLYAQGHITESENSKKAVERMRCDSDTVEAFLRDKCTNAGRTARTVLYEEYEKYCDENERQSVTAHNFYKSMRLKRFREVKVDGIYCFDKVTTLNDFVSVEGAADLPFD